MLYTVPDYYKKFHCLAGECPATCCAGWQIVIDQRSLQRYASLKGAFGNRVRNSVNWKEQTFFQYGKRCAFLNEENLCDMHIEAGAEMMCATCRKYPRHIEVFDNEREISLSMSCPAAAELILGRKTPVTFRTAEDRKQDAEDDGFDSFLYSALQDTRALLIEIMQNRKENVFLRMARTLALAHDVQNRISANRIFEIEEVLQSYRKENVQKKLTEKFLRKTQKNSKDIFWPDRKILAVLQEFEVLDENWPSDVWRWERTLAASGINCFFKADVISQEEYEQMMVYFLYTYFCGAVYDGNALSKVKMAVSSTLIWAWICCANWLEHGKQLDFKERLQLAWRYSRELEHSDPNLNKMEELAEDCVLMDTDFLIGSLVRCFS